MEYILIGILLGTKFRIDIIMLHNTYYINTYKCVCRHINFISSEYCWILPWFRRTCQIYRLFDNICCL